MEVQVTIIMPLYNAETTLREAADSVLKQGVDGLELLLVDDGSADSTAAICYELSQRDSRVKVIFQKNAGICAARNRGLQAASGRYIGFCDDDDVLLPGALPMLLRLAEEQEADIARADYELLREYEDGTFQRQEHQPGIFCNLEKDGYRAFLQNSGPQFVWNALYRRDALKGIVFDERCRYGLEDFIFNMTLYTKTSHAVYCPKVVYRHFERAQSTSVCQSNKAMQGRIRALGPWMDAEYKALKARCASAEQRTVWALRRAEAVTFLMHQLRDAKTATDMRKDAWRTLRKVLKSYPGKTLDFLYASGQNKKKALALLLYELHMEGFYDLLSPKPSK